MSLLLWLSWAGFDGFRTLIHDEGWYDISRSLRIAEGVGWAGLVGLLGLTVYAWTAGGLRILGWLEALPGRLVKLRWAALAGAGAAYLAFPALVFSEHGVYLEDLYTRSAVFLIVIVFSAVFLSVWHQEKSWVQMLPLSLLVGAGIYNLASYLPGVTTYPFALGWSETSRYYNASLFFDRAIYGLDLPRPHRDATRYWMQSLPFLFPTASLWMHRFWQALLRMALPLLAGYRLARRLKVSGRFDVLMFTLWTGLFLYQGPVFYPMLVIVIVMVWLFDSRRVWRSLVLVTAVSVWAGLTRINWIPMPGLIAAVIYLMERSLERKGWREIWQYVRPLAVWTGGGAAAGFAAQAWYMANSGLEASILQSSFSSDLLWYRLFPNPSFPPGILPMILLIATPGLLVISFAFPNWRKWHWVRPLGIGAILLVLFSGGLVVSVKIGGGTNLHNLDAFLVILLLVIAYLFYGESKDRGEAEAKEPFRPGWALFAVIVLVPSMYALTYGKPVLGRDFAAAEEGLTQLQAAVDQAADADGEILFITQRHLLTFDMIEGVELVHEYEKLLLMEMVMAGNEDYLGDYEGDLRSQRFALIVLDPLPVIYKNPAEYSLAAENNVMFKRINPILLCYYHRVKAPEPLRQEAIEFYLPLEVACE